MRSADKAFEVGIEEESEMPWLAIRSVYEMFPLNVPSWESSVSAENADPDAGVVFLLLERLIEADILPPPRDLPLPFAPLVDMAGLYGGGLCERQSSGQARGRATEGAGESFDMPWRDGGPERSPGGSSVGEGFEPQGEAR